MTYRPATAADRPALIDLLTEADLLTDDLPDDLDTFMLAYADGQLAGVAGLEVFGADALLRSVAVSASFRSQAIGSQLIKIMTALAENKRVATMYLITTTADRYFERLGFVRIDRANVSDAIAQTRQFNDLCPASAVVMQKIVAPIFS